jgi:hypothetical protein
MKKLSFLRELGLPYSIIEDREPEENGKFARCFKEVLKSEVKTLDLGAENEYNMSYKL